MPGARGVLHRSPREGPADLQQDLPHSVATTLHRPAPHGVASLGRALRIQRVAAGLSQAALAARVVMGHSMIAQLEHGTCGPSPPRGRRRRPRRPNYR
ncbi:MAG: hypothetical protein KatS3mg059_1684 [Thermomicrobiales bacterium]|nr:MAG: hypothetical protein KatS3mg059_1684 [Thermomicrobiales bacterium]